MRVLITGAAGFIGSQLAESCVTRGWSVTGVDCFTDYYDPKIKHANVRRVSDSDLYRLVNLNLATDDIEPLMSEIDVVFHLAAQAGVRASWGREFHNYTESNVTALQRLLEAARGAQLEKFVFASSSSVYGDAAELPTSEQARLAPISPYGATKVLGENLCGIYHRAHGIPVVSLRYFSVYGPRQRPDMAFWRLIDCALRDTEMTIYGDGLQTRDFTYVADVVQATMAAAERGRPGAIYNVGGGSRVSLARTIEVIGDELDRPLRLTRTAVQAGDARDTAADTSLAQRDLGYVPEWDVTSGLRAQIAWHRTAMGQLAPSS